MDVLASVDLSGFEFLEDSLVDQKLVPRLWQKVRRAQHLFLSFADPCCILVVRMVRDAVETGSVRGKVAPLQQNRDSLLRSLHKGQETVSFQGLVLGDQEVAGAGNKP